MKSLPASRSLLAAILGGSLAVGSSALANAQSPNPVGTSATQILLDKAHTLETHNRLDMAAQTWQQVLLSDPNNTEALAGLARAAKVAGNTALANSYLERLRAINPNDPGIARAEKVSAQGAETVLLQQAGKYAEAGQYAQAMAIYRKVFGKQPPPGDWALAFYETEAATEEGRPEAVAGLHALVEKYPTDSRYQIALGRILTYTPRTRAEGRRYLERHPSSPQAMDALRQSLIWDSANPASAPEIRAYLAKHNDAQLAAALRALPAPSKASAKPAAGRNLAATAADANIETAAAPDSPEVRIDRKAGVEMEAAYKALNAKHLEDAESRFKTILATDPQSARALAGMGYIRMQQSNFAPAVSFLEQAKQNGAKDAGLDSALATARFWATMGEASAALNENDLNTAQQQFQTALQLKPNSPEATEGLAGTLSKAQQYGPAAELYERVIKLRPTSASAWRGLFQSFYNQGNAAQALQVEQRIPASIRAQLMRDPDFLRTLASAFSAVGRDADAQRVLRTALELPFPADAGSLKIGTELQYAALLQAANHLEQAAGLYRQVLGADRGNPAAWQGLVRVQHAMHADAQALQTLGSMPLAVRDAAMRDTGFESTVASIEQSTNHLDTAQALLEHVIAQDAAANQKPSVGLELQLAGLYLARNNTAQAYPIYRQILAENPDRIDAWKGILGALHAAGHDQEALAQAQQIPALTRQQLELDPEYLQTIGSVYNALGQPQEASVFINRVQQHYVAQNTAAPADIDIQDAWLLFNSGNDSGLYRQLLQLGGRPDLSDEQRRTVQTIWSNWAVRRANQAAAAGDGKRSLAILNAAAKAFPDNPGVLRALASGYARAGLPKQSVLIFKAQDMTAATAADYKSAVGAALATNDQKDAETWLRYGLQAYPRDGEMLSLGAKFEQAHGNNGRAADYFRASIAALPPGDPGAELAGELSLPAPTNRLPTAAHQQDLATLLGGEDAAATAAAQLVDTHPYLPSYNNISGQPPVNISPSTYTGAPNYLGNSSLQPAQHSTLPSTPRTTTLGNYVPRSSAEPTIPGPIRLSPTPSAETAPQQAALTPDPLHAIRLSPVPSPSEQAAVTPDPLSSLHLSSVPNSSAHAAVTPDPLRSLRHSSVPNPPEQASTSDPLSSLHLSSVPTPSAQPAAVTPDPLRSVHLSAVPTPSQQATADPLESPLPQVRPVSSKNLYGDYTPSISASNSAGYTPAPVPVQLGSNANVIAPSTSEITDVLPTQRYLPGTPFKPESQSTSTSGEIADIDAPHTSNAQYTAQGGSGEAFGQQYPQPDLGPSRASAAPRRRRSYSSPLPAPASAPRPSSQPPSSLIYPSVPAPLTSNSYPSLTPAPSQGTPPSDADLVARNLPPLRGAFNPAAPGGVVPISKTEREQTELDLAALEASYSGWIGGTGVARYRSGTPGIDRLVDIEAPVEASAVLGKSVRVTVIPRPVFLNSGSISSASFTGAATTAIPYLGSLRGDLGSPAQQFASGVGGEFQLTTTNIGIAAGYTPYSFLVSNLTARAQIRFGHITLFGDRDSVRDTQLSYAGIRDPASVSSLYTGNIWGGVIYTNGGVRIDAGNEKSGFYLSGNGGTLTGFHVLDNKREEGTTGAYFRVHSWPGYGSLNVGGNFYATHYDHNERGLSYGQGGYFSPNVYFLASIPVTYTGSPRPELHYTIAGSVGVQTFQEDAAPYFPLDRALQADTGNPSYNLNSDTGLNYALNAQGSYRIADHWYVGGFATANNTRNYNTVNGGFFVRYLFKQQPQDESPTGLFPVTGFRPLRVP